MIRLDLSNGLTGEQVEKIIKAYAAEMARFEILEKYYNNENAILQRYIDPPKPNNKIAHSFCKYITNMATGYFMGKGVRIIIQDDKYKEAFTKALDEEYNKDIMFELAKEASKCGISYELLYINENTELRSKMFGARDFIPIYSHSVDEFLEGAIRIWQEQDLFTGKATDYAALYTDTEIITYKKPPKEKTYAEVERSSHGFEDVPVIVYQNNKERKGDFEDVISLVDAYDKAQSDTANDFEYFTDAYLVIAGAGGGLENSSEGEEDEDSESDKAIKTLKKERILFVDEKGQASWLIKTINDVAVENFKERIKKDMFFLAQVPALTDESFGNNLSGIAIKYKLIGLEELSVIKENKFRAAVRKKLKLITEWLNLIGNTAYNADDIEILFDRNVIENLTEIIENVSSLEGITSKETQLSLLPFIDEPAEEFEKILQEQQWADNYDTVHEHDFIGDSEDGDD